MPTLGGANYMEFIFRPRHDADYLAMHVPLPAPSSWSSLSFALQFTLSLPKRREVCQKCQNFDSADISLSEHGSNAPRSRSVVSLSAYTYYIWYTGILLGKSLYQSPPLSEIRVPVISHKLGAALACCGSVTEAVYTTYYRTLR